MQNLKLHGTLTMCNNMLVEGIIVKQEINDKKQALAKKAELVDWFLAIDANVRWKQKSLGEAWRGNVSHRVLNAELREGLYLEAGVIVY